PVQEVRNQVEEQVKPAGLTVLGYAAHARLFPERARTLLSGVLRKCGSSILPSRGITVKSCTEVGGIAGYRERRRHASAAHGRGGDKKWLCLKLELDRYPFDDRSGNLSRLLHIAHDQGVLAQQIDDARNATAEAVDQAQGVLREDGPRRARDAETLRHVGMS